MGTVDYTVTVMWVSYPPKNADPVGGSGRHFHIPSRATNFVLWRNRWCTVADEAMDLIDNLDEWLKEPNHSFEWENVDKYWL